MYTTVCTVYPAMKYTVAAVCLMLDFLLKTPPRAYPINFDLRWYILNSLLFRREECVENADLSAGLELHARKYFLSENGP